MNSARTQTTRKCYYLIKYDEFLPDVFVRTYLAVSAHLFHTFNIITAAVSAHVGNI